MVEKRHRSWKHCNLSQQLMILVFAQRISINVLLPFKLLTLQLKTTMTISEVMENLSCSFYISHESMNIVVKSILNWLLSFYWFDNKSINVVINTYSFSMFTSVWQVYIYIYIYISKFTNQTFIISRDG